MRVTVAVDEPVVAGFLPAVRPDGSGVGVNYVDQYLKFLKATLPDGRKLSARRRGLRITISIGDATGEALLRRLEHGPDVQTIFQKALAEAVDRAGATLTVTPGAVHLEL